MNYMSDIIKCVLIFSTVKFKCIPDMSPPCHTLGSDIFYFKKQNFLVVVDYFSK